VAEELPVGAPECLLVQESFASALEDPDAEELVYDHTETCDGCRSAFQEWEDTVLVLSHAASALPEPGVLAAAVAQRLKDRRRDRWLIPLRRFGPLALGALVVCLAGFAVTLALSNAGPSSSGVNATPTPEPTPVATPTPEPTPVAPPTPEAKPVTTPPQEPERVSTPTPELDPEPEAAHTPGPDAACLRRILNFEDTLARRMAQGAVPPARGLRRRLRMVADAEPATLGRVHSRLAADATSLEGVAREVRELVLEHLDAIRQAPDGDANGRGRGPRRFRRPVR
jgi:hypothetical protein